MSECGDPDARPPTATLDRDPDPDPDRDRDP
jgi:hypothetical protein